jgi:hypothetical protein
MKGYINILKIKIRIRKKILWANSFNLETKWLNKTTLQIIEKPPLISQRSMSLTRNG